MPDETQLVQQVKDTFGSSDEAARNLVEVTRGRREQRNIDNVFTPESLTPNELITVPRPQSVRGVQDDLSRLAVNRDSFVDEQQSAADLAQKQADISFQKQVEQMLGAPTRSELERSAEEELGIDTAGLSKKIADIDTQLLAEQESLLSKVERIEENRAGKLAGAIQSDIADAETDSLRKRLRLRIEKDFLNNDLTSAESRINRLVDIETEQIQRKMDVLDAIYTRDQDKFTKAEQRAYDAKLSEWEDAKQEKVTLGNFATEAAKKGASASEIQGILDSGNRANALIKYGYLLTTPTESPAPKLQNFGTSDNPNWRQYNYQTGQWETVSGIGSGLSAQQVNEIDRGIQESKIALDVINNLSENNRGIGAITGQFQNPTVSGFVQGGKNTGFDATTLLRYTPVIGNIIGAVQSRNDRDSALTDLTYIYNTEGFQEFIGFKQSGLTFGSLSDSERESIFAAANRLNSAVKFETVDDTRQITGYRGTDEQLRNDLKLVGDGLRARQDELNAQLFLNNDDKLEIINTQ